MLRSSSQCHTRRNIGKSRQPQYMLFPGLAFVGSFHNENCNSCTIMAPVQYPLSVNSWRSGRHSIVVRCQRSSRIIGSFPLDFVIHSGDATWQYIFWALSQLVELNAAGPPRLRSEDGRLVEMGSEVCSGTFYYQSNDEVGEQGEKRAPPRMKWIINRQDGAAVARWSRGPEYFRTTAPPSSEGSLSTRSNSKRSSVNQVRDRTRSSSSFFHPICRLLTQSVSISRLSDRSGWYMPAHRCDLYRLHC